MMIQEETSTTDIRGKGSLLEGFWPVPEGSGPSPELRAEPVCGWTVGKRDIATVTRGKVGQQDRSDASTEQQETARDLREELVDLFVSGRELRFQDGVHTAFSRRLVSIVAQYCDAAMEILAHLLVYDKMNPEVASEALRWLGQMEHPPSYKYRRWLLERCLKSASLTVREGAVLGLASLDDPHAIPYIEKAAQSEQCTELREDMAQVLSFLRTRRGGFPSQTDSEI